MSRSPFAPLTPEMLAEDRARRALAEAEIARKEAALADAEGRLAATRADIREMETELDGVRRNADEA
jgi:hypothetical protein